MSFATFLLGLINYGFTFVTQGRFTNMSALLLVTAVLIFMMSLISEQICQLRFERRDRRAPLKLSDPGAKDDTPGPPHVRASTDV